MTLKCSVLMSLIELEKLRKFLVTAVWVIVVSLCLTTRATNRVISEVICPKILPNSFLE